MKKDDGRRRISRRKKERGGKRMRGRNRVRRTVRTKSKLIARMREEETEVRGRRIN